MALQLKSPGKVFFGALTAHAVMDGLAIVLGRFLSFSFSSNVIRYGVGMVFIFLGLWTFVKLYLKKHKEKRAGLLSKTPFLASFLFVLLSEFGDKTQIVSGLLAARYTALISVFLGFVLALAAVIGFNVFVGSKIAEKIPRKTIKIITGFLFLLFGLFTLVFAV